MVWTRVALVLGLMAAGQAQASPVDEVVRLLGSAERVEWPPSSDASAIRRILLRLYREPGFLQQALPELGPEELAQYRDRALPELGFFAKDPGGMLNSEVRGFYDELTREAQSEETLMRLVDSFRNSNTEEGARGLLAIAESTGEEAVLAYAIEGLAEMEKGEWAPEARETLYRISRERKLPDWIQAELLEAAEKLGKNERIPEPSAATPVRAAASGAPTARLNSQRSSLEAPLPRPASARHLLALTLAATCVGYGFWRRTR